MKALPIPEADQMVAMLEGSIYELLRNYNINPEGIDFRKLITIDRRKIIDFLAAHPKMAETYFRKHSGVEADHDVERIWQEGSEFVTAWMDRGRQRSSRRFHSLPEAVAEHVLIAHGMY